MNHYLMIKNIHLLMIALSIAGFVFRGILMTINSPLLQAKLVRILPHVIDTALLVSGIWLATLLSQYPFTDGWLTAKLLALIAYIGLGVVALRRGRTKAIRLTAFVAALLCFAYMAKVAMTHDPLIGLA